VSPAPRPADVARLVRLPAVLTVPGDALLGAAFSGRTLPGTARRALAGCCLYLAGMALNDWADRDVDAVERPGRPIPSGAVSPAFALSLAGALAATGVAVAGLGGGAGALRAAVPLAGTVWAYDVALKTTPAAPAAMAAARGLDVLLGASPTARAAAVPAGLVAAHTLALTRVSVDEVDGEAGRAAAQAGVVTAAVAVIGAVLALRSSAGPARTALSCALLSGYAASVGRADADAARRPSPATAQRAVGTGVLGLLLLQAGLHATRGPVGVTAALAAAWPVARQLARRRGVT
jgi:hypothetical protein